jgi:N-acetylneuraminic acid mutarotase
VESGVERDNRSTCLGCAGPGFVARVVRAARVMNNALSSGRWLAAVGVVAALVFAKEAQAQSWTAGGSMASARSGHAATLLANGDVLVEGGLGISSSYLGSAELYNPATQSWSSTNPLANARFGHTATLLSNSQVLVVGGNENGSPFYYVSAELYDPIAGTWSSTGSLATGRTGHTATLLPNGQVLVAGGIGNVSSFYLGSAELYDPSTGR